jgi:hypothetical protein
MCDYRFSVAADGGTRGAALTTVSRSALDVGGRLAVRLIHVVGERFLWPRNVHGHRSTRMTVMLSSSPDDGEHSNVLAKLGRTLNRNHPGVRGRLHAGIQAMFNDTEDQGIVRRDNLQEGESAE